MFKPKPSEVRTIKRWATECEINARAADRLKSQGQVHWAYAETAKRYSASCFLLASVVATRGRTP